MKFYSFETMFSSLKDDLIRLLKDVGIYYELSDGRMSASEGMVWHFEIKCNEHQMRFINAWLDARPQCTNKSEF